ncbi:MAG: hypothetical protein RMJ48_07430 [Roseiflexaceae bacterium]|nr:hypothetical protein [Roseiflexaceae bacterium]
MSHPNLAFLERDHRLVPLRDVDDALVIGALPPQRFDRQHSSTRQQVALAGDARVALTVSRTGGSMTNPALGR